MTVLALGDAGMTIDEAVEALDQIGAEPARRSDRHGRDYWQHRCAHPDHADDWPSATVTADDAGRLLFNCFACAPPPGSSTRTRWVAQVVGRLKARTPKDPPSGAAKARAGGSRTGTTRGGVKIAHYDYVTADGELVARKVRFEPKSFLWQRPYGDSWVDGLNRRPLHDLPLYGLHSVLQAPPALPVFVVEGEKDVDRLHSLGAPAVCAAGSHPHDIPADLEPLAGRTVIVVADRDAVGITLARAWHERLPGSLIAQPAVTTPKADISDHLDAGLGLDRLDYGPLPAAAEPAEVEAPPVELPPTLADELAADRLLAEEVATQLRRQRAREILAEMRERANPKPPPDCGTVAELLARPETAAWRIDGILPAGGRMLFVAQRKTGKTTATGNLGRSLITGHSFLGRFGVEPLTGRIAVLNYEVTGATFARWMDDIGVPGQRMYVENLRGRTNPLATEAGRLELVERLRAAEAEVLVVDPFGRAYHGTDQNDAAMVTPWLVALDQIAEQAGCTELILTAHAGWNGERTRGSSALEDWPDVIVTLTKDAETDQRYIRAEGRDVDLDEDRIEYHDLTRTYTLTGEGSKAGAADRRNLDRLVEGLVDVVRQRPGLGVAAIARAWRDEGFNFTNGDEQRASREAVARGHVSISVGLRGAKQHFLTASEGSPPPPPPTPSAPPPRTYSTSPYRYGGGGGGEVEKVETGGSQPVTVDLGLVTTCSTCDRQTVLDPCEVCRGR